MINHQVSIDELMRKEEKTEKVVLPKADDSGMKVFTIPDDVWENRCQQCIHKNAEENAAVPSWALYMHRYSKLIPCRILGISQMNERPGECMSFAPKFGLYGICASCKHDSIFHDGFCTKEDHAPERRVYYGQHYGGDDKKRDYYGRHRLSVCDDYEPDEYAKKGGQE